MANNADLIRERLAQFRRTPRGYGRVLRNSLSRIIVDRLEEHGWSQRQLAEAAGMRESFISRVIHGASNCTFDVAGRILHAVGAPAAVYDTTEYTVVPAPLLAQSDQTLSDDDDRQTEIASYIRITARPICRFTVQGEDDVIWAAPGPPDNMVFHGSDLDPGGSESGGVFFLSPDSGNRAILRGFPTHHESDADEKDDRCYVQARRSLPG